MKNKAFISIYVLIILSIISISLSFIYRQSLNNQDLNEDIYNKKKIIYKLESLNNIALSNDERLTEFLEKINENKASRQKFSYKIDYMGEEEKLLISKISDNNFLMEKDISYKKVRAESKVFLELYDKYQLYNEDKIILNDKFDEFFKNLKFKEYEFKEYEKLVLDGDLDSKIKVTNELIIKNDRKNSIVEAKSSENNDNKSLDDFNDKSKTACKISGILIIDGNLILEKDLEINGLLIISGDIKSINDCNLSLNGQIIAKNDFDIDYNYDKSRSYDFIKDIYNPKILKVKSKEVY
ncbi:hypothetical protein HV819_03360 [Anaerococcus sp. AGMB00486]|uniref:Polymer-forming cytoskeletal protein n=1 Tax=Anaerococcus faecalis TaxID=2742993 RepID=A0ABX2N8L7_9FIRM|nr:hypothetical protein [Anaerococcus faecalis]NVF11029.1 hypothetical protein [Anaerococcus faecalis]